MQKTGDTRCVVQGGTCPGSRNGIPSQNKICVKVGTPHQWPWKDQPHSTMAPNSVDRSTQTKGMHPKNGGVSRGKARSCGNRKHCACVLPTRFLASMACPSCTAFCECSPIQSGVFRIKHNYRHETDGAQVERSKSAKTPRYGSEIYLKRSRSMRAGLKSSLPTTPLAG